MRLSEVLSALTYALDLTEGQRPGHTVRTAIIAMRLGRSLALDDDTMGALYFAALLKDAGCSSNAARMAALFGSDDQKVKRDMRMVDWHDRFRLAMRTAQSCGVGRGPLARLRHFLAIARTPAMTREIIQARCERGAQIANGLGFPTATSEAISHVDEHWCGLGHPVGLAGHDIPLLSRILLLSQTVEAYWTEAGVSGALDMARRRSGTWFDPSLVNCVLTWRRDLQWWQTLSDTSRIDSIVVGLEPAARPMLATDARLDAVAQSFASVIDAKTPFTYRHSTNVARYAMAVGDAMGLNAVELRALMRAGLLHDIGKLGISNRILDKPAQLTSGERAEMMKHPLWTLEILERVPAFHQIATSAAQHHERLDGAGYPWKVNASGLGTFARILAVADVYEALTAERPYRGGLGVDKSLEIMSNDVGLAFDPYVFDAANSLARAGVLERLVSLDSAGEAYAQLTGSATLQMATGAHRAQVA